MDGAAWLLEARAQAAQSFTPTLDGGRGIFQLAGVGNQSQSAAQIINDLRFAAARSIRTSTIILAAFNAVAAFSTAFGILYDCYTTRRRNNRRYRLRTAFIQASDVYPLVLSIGITIQAIGFAVIQARGLDDLMIRGCTLISQFMLPIVFIVPYIQLVFGLEVAVRGLAKKAFSPRGKWTVIICTVIVGALMLANFLVADFIRSPDRCFASLFWFIQSYSEGCFAVLLVIALLLLAALVSIFVRLSRIADIDTSERVCASRMVYYLAMAVVSNTLLIPFFFDIAFTDQSDPNNQALTLSMVASVVSNVSGLMTGGLYLFLRSNTLSTIGPKKKLGGGERTRIKQQIRRFRPGDGHGGAHMMHSANTDYDLRRMLSDASLISSAAYDKEEDATLVGRGSPVYDMPQPKRPNPLRSNATYPLENLVKAPQLVRMGSSGSSRGKSPYGVMPSADNKPLTVLPATIYTPGPAKNKGFDFSTLKPPPSIKNLAVGKHRRDSSMASSATVQIGLRFSNVEDMPPLNPQVPDKKVYRIDGECPHEAQPKTTEAAKRPSPLAVADPRPSTSDSASEYSVQPAEAKMKTLPPVPRPVETKPAEPQRAVEDDGPRLSPAVYNPNPQSPTKATKLPSPRGVGFSSPPLRSASSAARSPPPRAQASGSPHRAPSSDKGGDWI